MANAILNQIFLFLLILLCFIEAECRTCWYNGYGYTKYFYCAVNQYCCGPACCQSVVSFYRLWYFWLCIIMVLLFCSGGGYWFRNRYAHRPFMMSGSGSTVTNNGISGGSRGVVLQTAPERTAQNQTSLYPQGNVQPTPPAYTAEGAPYQTYPASYQFQSFGPPPSYDTVYGTGATTGSNNQSQAQPTQPESSQPSPRPANQS
ncbi:WW domain binding protein VOPP1-like [Lineus longissimus]|uniref:WW domain binding protein VOPP1-like n=1 Tax=Lineus longissimus TaxID=88925 RepID=UPI002B4F7C62